MARASAVLIAAAALLATVTASPVHGDHVHPAAQVVADEWYHPAGHRTHALFARDNTDVGSPAWLAQFPDEFGKPDYSAAGLPPSWLAAYNAAVAAGSIPTFPPTTVVAGQNPVYAAPLNGLSTEVCSGTSKCRAPGDVWDPPAGVLGLAFDDGPTAASPVLYQFLQANNLTAMHFMIGRNIAQRPQIFLAAFNQGEAVAVHTWSHPYMTSLNDTAVVAELGWAMQIIYDSSGGRVPRFWRPPYGDADNRVRAIAREVFGLTTVFWNQDTEDWSLEETPPLTTPAAITANVNRWMSGAQTPTGLMMLEHELGNDTIAIFTGAVFPNIAKYNWKPQAVQTFLAESAYVNAADNTASVSAETFATSSVSSTATSSPSGASGGSVTVSSGSPSGSAGSQAKKGAAPRSVQHINAGALALAALLAVLCT